MRIGLRAVFVLCLCATTVWAQPMPLVKRNQPEKGYYLRAAQVRGVVWSDKGYTITLLPPSLRTTLIMVRPASTGRDWPNPSDYTATAECAAYLVVRSEYNGKTDFSDAKVKKLIAAGWTEVDESFGVVVPQEENWKWRIFTREVPKGNVDLKVEDVKLEAMTIFLFGKKREGKPVVKTPDPVKPADPVKVQGPQVQKSLDDHPSGVDHIAFSPDGKRLVAGCGQTVKVWDMASAKPIVTFDAADNNRVEGVAISPDGKTVASCGLDHALKLWEVAGAREARLIKVPLEGTTPVRSIAFSPDGKTIAEASDYLSPRLWDVTTGKLVRSFPRPQANEFPLSLAFTPDGKTLVAGYSNWISILDVASGKERSKIVAYSCKEMAISSDGKTVACQDSLKSIKLWDLASGKEKTTLSWTNLQNVLGLALSPDGKLLASCVTGKEGNAIQLWDTASGKELDAFYGHMGGMVRCVAFSPAGGLLASGGEDRSIKLWKIQTIGAGSGAGSEDKQAIPEKLAGTWEGTRIDKGFGPGLIEQIELTKEGKARTTLFAGVNKQEVKESTYTIDGDKITFRKDSSDKGYTFTIKKLTSGILILEDDQKKMASFQRGK